MSDDHLQHRLNRIQGQIEAIRKRLGTEEVRASECEEVMRLVKASRNALKTFAQAYADQYVDRCLTNLAPELREENRHSLQSLLRRAFDQSFQL